MACGDLPAGEAARKPPLPVLNRAGRDPATPASAMHRQGPLRHPFRQAPNTVIPRPITIAETGAVSVSPHGPDGDAGAGVLADEPDQLGQRDVLPPLDGSDGRNGTGRDTDRAAGCA
ncbi:hypothetical protein LNKW23_43790 [Paralimibaculum aggregatum]|uniref:Uncharacterized protein n=1 Tax=Paralimibaculum aggregatum TaxID=3036245 RepID=A0ABQ6LSU9_9RHOB|nr:hypothetical protein LNKW23_43790 [Limibaculum sp. NKW23]